MNSHVVFSVSIFHKKVGNGSAADGDRRRVGGVGDKSDIGLASTRNSGGYGLDVFGVGTGKQGRKREVAVVVCRKLNSVSESEIIRACGRSDATADLRGRGS